MIVDVAFLPSAASDIAQKVAIVVDALRASATIIALFEAGASSVVVAANPAEALALAGRNRDHYVICGESGGHPPPGFDHGNSPPELVQLDLRQKQSVLSTSNGTRALASVAAARVVFVATGMNGDAVVRTALDEAESTAADLTIVCAGDEHGSLVSLEDVYFAGFLVELVASERRFVWPVDESNPGAGDPTRHVLDESAVMARRLYRSYAPATDVAQLTRPARETVLAMMREARNGHTLPRNGYAADLDYCAQIRCSTVVPRLKQRDGRLTLVTDA